MITIQKTAFSLAALILTVSVGSLAQANHDTYRHIDKMAKQIESKAKIFKNQMRKYRHTPEYEHLVNDAIEMCRLADHVHEVAHVQGDLAHLDADLRDLDRTFHHIQGLVERIEHNAAYGAGHVHGNTRYIWTLLHDMEECIHHIQDDVRSLRLEIARAARLNRYGNSFDNCVYDRYGRRVETSVRGTYGSGYGNTYGRSHIDNHGSSYGPGYGYGTEARLGRNVKLDNYGRGGITLGNGGMQFRIGF